MMTLRMYAQATSCATTVDALRGKLLADSNATEVDWMDVSQRLGGLVIFNDRDDSNHVVSNLWIFPDGSCYYDDETDDYALDDIDEFIENRTMLLKETVDGVPLFARDLAIQEKARLETLRLKCLKYQRPAHLCPQSHLYHRNS